MPNDGTGTGWDTSSPEDDDLAGVGAQEIRDLRLGVGIRNDKEHSTFDITSEGGEHKPGSAVSYFQDPPPTLRPDGVTSLDGDDVGRSWVDTGTGALYTWNGSSWDQIIRAPGTIVSSELAVGSKVLTGAYIGNGSTTGPIVTVGFLPKVIFICLASGGGKMFIVGGGSVGNAPLFQPVDASSTPTGSIALTNTTFQVNSTNTGVNANTAGYNYVAFG